MRRALSLLLCAALVLGLLLLASYAMALDTTRPAL
jgi:hypothetical protein